MDKFIPVIIGTDLNAYAMARCFHEAYGIKPVVVGKLLLPFVKYSNIISDIVLHTELWGTDSFLKTMISVAEKYDYKNQKLILVGTNDFYVRLIIENTVELKKYFTFSYIDENLMNKLLVKANFYPLCKEYGLEIPETFIYSCKNNDENINFNKFPAIIKPSNGVEYLKHHFEGQQKVFKVDNIEELKKVIGMVVSSGYTADLIIQDFIPGDDTYMWDSVFYCNTAGKAKLISFAQVVLQEHTKTAIGNYTALIARYNEEMMHKLQAFLEHLGYVGFANFDIKFDARDGKFKIFEVNIRQGRSSFYVTACGYNLAKYLVDDVLYHREQTLTLVNKPMLFTVVPHIVLNKFVENISIRDEARKLIHEGHYVNPLFYKKDRNIMRAIYMFFRQLNYIKKYRENTW